MYATIGTKEDKKAAFLLYLLLQQINYQLTD